MTLHVEKLLRRRKKKKNSCNWCGPHRWTLKYQLSWNMQNVERKETYIEHTRCSGWKRPGGRKGGERRGGRGTRLATSLICVVKFCWKLAFCHNLSWCQASVYLRLSTQRERINDFKTKQFQHQFFVYLLFCPSFFLFQWLVYYTDYHPFLSNFLCMRSNTFPGLGLILWALHSITFFSLVMHN